MQTIANMLFVVVSVFGLIGVVIEDLQILRLYRGTIFVEFILSNVGLILSMIKAGQSSAYLIVTLAVDLAMGPLCLFLSHRYIKQLEVLKEPNTDDDNVNKV